MSLAIGKVDKKERVMNQIRTLTSLLSEASRANLHNLVEVTEDKLKELVKKIK